MSEELPNNPKTTLAIALAQGVTAARWARTNDVPRMTAYRWAKEPEVRAEVESIRRRYLDRAVGRMAKRATWAADKIARLADNAQSETVQLKALRAVLSDMMAVSKFSGLEARMTGIEEKLRARAAEATSAGWSPPLP
jgi:hypothetical protein